MSASMHPHESEPVEPARAFETVVREHYSAIWQLLWSIVQHEEHTDDLVQQVFLAAQAEFSGLAADAHVPSWLRQIAVREALRLPRSGVVAKPGRALLAECLRSLDGSMRVVVALQLSGASYEETARILGIHVKTVRARVLLSRTALLKCAQRKRAARA
jgi:DNA-directed RNA polymerase specialized sigma24 family protein